MPNNVQEMLGKASPEVVQALLRLIGKVEPPLYLVGGTLRDWILGRESADIDITSQCSAASLAKLLRIELGGGAIVDLSGADDEAYRVVFGGTQVDFASFRAGTTTIEEDLRRRDFTINAIAVRLSAQPTEGAGAYIDPTGGLRDLCSAKVQHCPDAFVADPLRMLRGYRLCATLDFQLAAETRAEVRKHASSIGRVSAERIGYELGLIFASPRTSSCLQAMHEDGLLACLLPELYAGEGIQQPEFHHLDVLGHSFLALAKIEEILAEPERFFPGYQGEMNAYLQGKNIAACLKWAALLHDIGKPATQGRQSGNTGRVTFYRHDEEGQRIFKEFAGRSRWSNADIERTGKLIAMHMHPFHLCNIARETPVTKKAVLKLCNRAGMDLPGLFLLAMSDSLAGCGKKKPERMEEELLELFATVQKMYQDCILPLLSGPPLLTGKDLINEFSLEPGPLFRILLEELELARLEGEVTDHSTALAFVASRLKVKTAK